MNALILLILWMFNQLPSTFFFQSERVGLKAACDN